MQRVGEWLRDNRTLLMLAAVLVLVRLITLTMVEAIWPSLERFYPGTVAREIAGGMKLSFFDYAFSSYESGWLLAGLVCLPFMKVFGFTSLGMAVPAVLLDVLQFCIFYQILRTHINARVALLYGVQYVAAPYVLQATNLYIGFNYFNLPITTAIFLAFYLRVFRNNTVNAMAGGKMFTFFLLGLLGGFSTWLCLAFMVLAVPCVFHWAVYVRSARWRDIGGFLIGIALGLSPFILRLGAFSRGIKRGVVDRIVAPDTGGIFEGLTEFLAIEPAFAWSVYFQFIEILGTILFFALLIWKRRALWEALRRLVGGRVPHTEDSGVLVIYVFYILTFMTVFLTSEFSSERYLQPVYPFLFGCQAMLIDGMLRAGSRGVRRGGMAVLSVLLLLAVADCAAVPLFRAAPNLKLFRDQAYSYELIGSLASWRFRLDPRRVLSIHDRFESDADRLAYMRGFGFELAVESQGTLADDYFLYLHKHYPDDILLRKALRKGLLLGHGQGFFQETALAEFYPSVLREVTSDDVLRFVRERVWLIGFEDEEYRSQLYQGLGVQFFAVAPPTGLGWDDVMPYVDQPYRQDFLNGRPLAERYRDQIKETRDGTSRPLADS